MTTGKIATITGRYYAMDRDKRWERVRLAYDALVKGIGEKSSNPLESVTRSYSENITDEFIKPIINTSVEDDKGKIKDGDSVICFNFRTDRCREITEVLTQQDMHEYDMHSLKLHYTTMTEYDKTFKQVNVIFDNDNLTHTIGEVIASKGLRQIRIAETEKYPHVTFFLAGKRNSF